MADANELKHRRYIANLQLVVGALSTLLLTLLGYYVTSPQSQWAGLVLGLIALILVSDVASFFVFNNQMADLEK
ncbi:MAG: hypothetical protein V1822_00770 [Candidatus Micrarchaeota archaeon]